MNPRSDSNLIIFDGVFFIKYIYQSRLVLVIVSNVIKYVVSIVPTWSVYKYGTTEDFYCEIFI